MNQNELRETTMFSSHPSEPMVDQRGIPDPCPGNDCDDIYMLARPCIIQENDVRLRPNGLHAGRVEPISAKARMAYRAVADDIDERGFTGPQKHSRGGRNSSGRSTCSP